MNTPSKVVARNVLNLRKELGLTQEALATKAKISGRTVTRLETGIHTRLDETTLIKIARAFEVPVMTLFASEEIQPAKSAQPPKKLIEIQKRIEVARCDLRDSDNRVKKLKAKLAAAESAKQAALDVVLKTSRELIAE